MRAVTYRLASLCLCVLPTVAACNNGSSATDGGDPGVDAAPPDLMPAPPPYPPPLAAPSMPELLTTETWFAAQLDTTSDSVLAAIEKGTLEVPGEGNFAGADWYATTPDENGSVGAGSAGLPFFALARVNVPAGKHVFARLDSWGTLYANGSAQPGDPYGSGAHRVPVLVKPGQANDLVFRTTSGRGDPRVELRMTDDELYFNPNDLTTFDPVAGSTDEQWLGVPVLNLTDTSPSDVDAIVEESDLVKGTMVRYPGLPPVGVTKVAFQVIPKAGWPAAGTKVTIGVRILARGLYHQYRSEITLTTVETTKTYKRSFRSAMDRSAQYMGVVPPSNFDAKKSDYAMVLTLHGAGVEGIGQAQSYAQKDYAYVVAATNRRPFGFDWEEWGRHDAIEVLEEAQRVFKTAADRVYLTGHSMGGHGTWNVGVLFPGRFAVIGPSAGWASFYTYARQTKPTGAFARSQASSDTYAYLKNLSRRACYGIHGTKDDNVPISEMRNLVAALRMYTMDVQTHEQVGAGHWWGDPNNTLGGAACVDFPALFATMQARRLDPSELEFDFTTPLPSVNAKHSFVTVRAQKDFTMDAQVISAKTPDGVALTTKNVRGMVLDGKALKAKGVAKVTVDGGAPLDVVDGDMPVGPQDGKRPGAYGPFNDVLRRPFCYVWADEGPATYRRYAGFLSSAWDIIGNGQTCAVPLSRVDDALRAAYQIVYLGVRPAALDALKWPISWTGGMVNVDGVTAQGGVLITVLPEKERLNGVIATAEGSEGLLYRYQPFHSGFAAPDYMLLTTSGVKTAGFVGADWSWGSRGAGRRGGAHAHAHAHAHVK